VTHHCGRAATERALGGGAGVRAAVKVFDSNDEQSSWPFRQIPEMTRSGYLL
jgi:hypothetical protein